MLFPPGLSNTFIAASLSFCSSGSRGKLRLTPSKRMIIYDNDQWSMVLKCRKPPWFIGFSPYITIRTEWFLSSAKILARKWCILPDMISIDGDPQWMDAFRMENPSINLGIPPFRKPLIWYFIDFNPHPHDICQNPSKMASNHRENDQGDCSMSLQSIGIIRNLSISYSGTQSSIFLYDLLLIIIFPMKSLVDFSKNPPGGGKRRATTPPPSPYDGVRPHWRFRHLSWSWRLRASKSGGPLIFLGHLQGGRPLPQFWGGLPVNVPLNPISDIWKRKASRPKITYSRSVTGEAGALNCLSRSVLRPATSSKYHEEILQIPRLLEISLGFGMFFGFILALQGCTSFAQI